MRRSATLGSASAAIAACVLAIGGGASAIGAPHAHASAGGTPHAHASAAGAFQRVTVANGDLQLPALIAHPAGDGPFPAVVLLHGCSGLWSTRDRSQPQSHIKRWLTTLAKRGYVAIAVDSFSPRGVRRVCNQPPSRTGVSEVTDRARDAFAALDYLRSRPDVTADRVGVLGWSNGGSTALATVGSGAPVQPPAAGGFSTAVAFYPGCGLRSAFKRYRPTVPTRVLAAARDPLAGGCRSLAKHAGKQLHLTIYRGASHSFDESAKPGRDALARKLGGRLVLTSLTKTLALANAQGSSIFSPQSWTNAPLAPDAPLDSNQAAAGALRSQVLQFGTWVNTTTWSAPIYVVPADQPRIAVRVNSAYSRYSWSDAALLATDLDSVPLPDASPAGPPESKTVSWSDHELIVYQPSSDTAWELYHLVHGQWGWSVTDGGRITQVSSSNGSYNRWLDGKPHGMTGSGIPLLAGLQRIDELQRGSIDHAVALSIPHVRQGVIRRPATRSDGEFTSTDAIPEGTRFRLPANLNIDALALTPYARIVAKAIQAHGAVVVDKNCRAGQSTCPAVTFKAEDPRPRPALGIPNPYDVIFGGVAENHLFDNFPWDQLQVLAED